ncbi:hypothetical protein PROFUN_10162 [Planoprotostelium fungivorum]|uniref:Cytochrome b5 heme-binding domain-containing protein n=1 Tax=Planoprotostelium fungivorum TaxID=1890364 RepID=A0A2P6NEK0_9EUKA|nr:hypothetical protein PROFUN_10162 [Planoprotostelium fungivorum]
MPELRTFTVEEVAKHNKKDDLWIIVDGTVYDLSNFAELHPGGGVVLYDEDVAGKDSTEVFYQLHRHEVLDKYKRYAIGHIEGHKPTVRPFVPGALSDVPYAEPTWLTPAYSSPYYNEGHRKFQKWFREFCDKEACRLDSCSPEDGKRISDECMKKITDINLHRMRLGPGKHLHGQVLPTGLKGEDFDYFHELIINQELCRMSTRGFQDGFLGGMVIGLPPVLNFARPELKEKICNEVFSGKKFISLAISEAFAGSDVAGLRCTATKSECGKFYIVNGTKKWITNGTFSDYFSTGVRTDAGLSMLLIERGDGVETKPIKTSYSPTAGTAYIIFEDVKVPVENLLGEENKGLQVILSNFNHERWVMVTAAVRGARTIVEECIKWAVQRKVFGKPLVSQAVIRNKLAAMISLCESHQAWLENVTYQMTKMNYKQQSKYLAGQIGLLKASATRASHFIADQAVQILGGRGITKTGMGSKVENFARTVKFDAILGGSEEVLMDLGVRQALRNLPASKM